MSITSTLLKFGAPLALAHLASRIRIADLQRLAGVNLADLKRLGLDRADTAFGTIGLRRVAAVTSSTSLVLGGFLAGAVVGAGALFFSYTERGVAVRRRAVGLFRRHEVDREAVAATQGAAPDAGGNSGGGGQHDVEVVAG